MLQDCKNIVFVHIETILGVKSPNVAKRLLMLRIRLLMLRKRLLMLHNRLLMLRSNYISFKDIHTMDFILTYTSCCKISNIFLVKYMNMMGSNSESVLERIPDFTSKIEQLFFFGEKFSINITPKFPPPRFFEMSPNVARLFSKTVQTYFNAKIFPKPPKIWLGLVCRCCTFKFRFLLPSW